MSKITSLILVATVSLINADCPAENGKLSFTGACTFASIASARCDLASLSIDESQLLAACEEASTPFKFSDINDDDWTFDDIYFSGGGPFNNDIETDGEDKKLANRAAHLARIRSNVASTRPIGWPEYDGLTNYTLISHLASFDFDKFHGEELIANDFEVVGAENYPPYPSQFNLTSDCRLNTIMCCFTDERLDTPLEDNSDICMHNLRDSYKSNHISNGYGVYDSDVPAYCVGYHWDDDETSDSYQYRGNALFDISFGTFLDKGYVKNVPGAPLCGCIEQMPVVSNSACKEVVVEDSDKWILTNTGEGISIVQDSSVTVRNCEGDLGEGDLNLKSFIAATASVDVMEDLSERLVDDCERRKAKFLNDNFLVPDLEDTASNFEFRDETTWQHVAGKGLYYYPTKNLLNLTIRDVEFRAYFDQSPNKIVYRHCPSCHPSHQNIYYRRHTSVPDTMNLIELFLNNWREEDNIRGVDFDLFSTYEEAVANMSGGKWKFCNFASDRDIVGFPRDCGITEFTACQWNTHIVGKNPCGPRDYSTHSHGFYIETPNNRV